MSDNVRFEILRTLYLDYVNTMLVAEGKAIALGEHSLVLTLPKVWRDNNHLVRNDRLIVEIKEKSLTIRPTKKFGTPASISRPKVSSQESERYSNGSYRA